MPNLSDLKLAGIPDIAGYLDFKGNIDCSANPNYPAASKGDVYVVSVAGKIGGGSGTSVVAGDSILCKLDTASGTQAGVGANWFIIEHANPDWAEIANIPFASQAEAEAGTENTKIITALRARQGFLKANGWVVKTGAYAAVIGDRLLADTTAAAFTITLPGAPNVGDAPIRIADAEGTFAINNLTINRNGNSIDGNAGNLICDVAGMTADLIWVGGAKGWAVYGR
jgi:predicted RNA-binding protein with TRAM domain